MESVNDKEMKNRTSSSSSSVTEFVNETFEKSELQSEILITIPVSSAMKDVQNPFLFTSVNKKSETLRDFSDLPRSNENSQEFSPKGFRKMYLAALVVLLFPVCMGMATTYSATATADMKKKHSSIHPTDDEVTFIGSFIAIGALIGGTAAGYFSNALGRKGTLMLNIVPFVIGWLFIVYAGSVRVIYIGRIITGYCTGIVSVITPMYLVEISTPEIRGLLGASFQLFVVTGVLMVASLGAVLTWRWLAASSAMICLLAGSLMVFMPESPKWLMSQKQRGEAKHVIKYLQGDSYDAEGECQKLEEEIKTQPTGNVHWTEFKAPTAFKPFILSILLMFFQQFCGVNAILFYTVDIFKSAKIPLNPIAATVLVSFVQVIATLLSSMLMDRAGRKPLLLISGALMAVSLFTFGGYDFAKSQNVSVAANYGWLPVVCLTTYIAAFAIGFGPTPWLMVAEMTPIRFRGVVSGISTALNWTFSFIITKSFKALETGIEGYGVYWFYGTFCIISMFITKFFLPETKGKKMREIEDFFIHSS